MKRTLALLAGAAFLATATPALADSYRGGYTPGYNQSSFRGNDFGLRARVDQVTRELNVAYRQGVIDHGALTRAMSNVNSYRFMMRDGVSGYEARRITIGLNGIEHTLAEKRAYFQRNHRGHRGW